MVGSATASLEPSRSSDLPRAAGRDAAERAQAVEEAVLHFRITEDGFRGFEAVAAYRQSAGLEVLPGFPERPMLARAALELDRDAGTREWLATAGISGRDYVLTGWALVLAHDPQQWGLQGDRLTAEMRSNIAFTRSHAEAIDALLGNR